MVQGGQTLVKYLLFFFNFLFVVTGIALIALGAIVKTNATKYSQYLGNEARSISIFLIVLGVIIFIIAFLGCCGAIKENYCMVMTFAVLLSVIFIMEFAAGIAAYVYRGKLHNLVDENLKNDIRNYKPGNADWDSMQSDLSCCGSNNYTDWQENELYKGTDLLPNSCCKGLDTHKNCTTDFVVTKGGEMGCLQALEDSIMKNIAAIGGTGIGIAFVEVVGIIFACCLARAIKKEYETV